MKTLIDFLRPIVPAALVGLMVSVMPASALPGESSAEVITGSIVNMMGGGKRVPFTEGFTITIEGYTPVEDLDGLAALQQAKGDEALQSALWEVKEKGYIQIGTTLGYPLAVITSVPQGGGKMIRIITDRPIQYREVWHSIRTLHYPYSVFEITLNGKGKGEGQFIPLAKVNFKPGGVLDVEGYAALPFKLVNVKAGEK